MSQTFEGAQKVAAQRVGVALDEYRARVAAGLKWCTCCRDWKARGQFCADKSRFDGRSAKCDTCRRVKVRVSTKGRPSTFKGRTHTPEARALIGAATRGRRPRLGIPHTVETRAKISAITRERTPRGAAHYAYKGGARERNRDLRRRPEYFVWRMAVFERDGYCCRDCGDARGGNLRAHHDKPLSTHPELAYDVDNGVTLCHPCHEQRHFKPNSIRNQRKVKRGEKLWR